MTNNICGNSASPLRGGVNWVGDIPTLRIGLISGVPLAQRIFAAMSVFVIFMGLLFFQACTSRTVYEPASVVTPAPNAMNINTATVGELEHLPYVGRKTAEAIVEFRNLNGPFRRVEQLMQIRGISEERFAALRSHIKIE